MAASDRATSAPPLAADARAAVETPSAPPLIALWSPLALVGPVAACVGYVASVGPVAPALLPLLGPPDPPAPPEPLPWPDTAPWVLAVAP